MYIAQMNLQNVEILILFNVLTPALHNISNYMSSYIFL